METKIVYKLTDQNLQTYNGYQWNLGKWQKRPGTGDLCSNGWLHYYHSKELAQFLNPIHANIDNPRLFIAESRGASKDDKGLKGGSTQLKIIEEIQYVKPTTEQCVKFAIFCGKAVYRDATFNKWADSWLDGTDRSYAAADSAAAAARYAAARYDAAAAAAAAARYAAARYDAAAAAAAAAAHYADAAARYADARYAAAAASAADSAAAAAAARYDAAALFNLIAIAKKAME